MEEKLVSVIVPIYNVEPYLNQCVKSIVTQTYDNLEIILVDDGSPDHCPEICDKWAKRIRGSGSFTKERRVVGCPKCRPCALPWRTGDVRGFG